ncbi:hypothetical protein [Streptomyces sp. NPDC001919]
MPQVDTRLVQTAVIGGRDSDQPVILPEEPHNLDEFRRQFGTDRFWCGTLLGGCGEKLMTKRYETKVCHFSHYPAQDGSRSACHRTANGVDSADHLFIKMHVKEWLTQQGHAAQAELRSLNTGPGDAVDFWLRATQQHLRFELQPEDYSSWRRAADSLGAKEGHVEWVFGPDGPITRDVIARQGYALRVRCETAGTDRSVLLGTVTDKQPVGWAPLHECRMTTDGIVTPQLEELRATGAVRAGGMRNAPFPGNLPLRATELIFALDPGRQPPLSSPLTHRGRYLVPGFIKPTGSRILRAYLSLPEEVPAPTEHFVYRLSGLARLVITDPLDEPGSVWAVHADSLVRLNGLDAERTGLWRPSVSLPAAQVSAPAHTVPDALPVAPAEAERPSTVADQIRQELKKVARERTTVTWDELARRTGVDLSHMPDPKRRDLLAEVDEPLRAEVPLLCVLVRTPSGRHPFYLGAVLRKLGAQAPGSETALRRWREKEKQRNYDTYSPKLTTAQPPRPAHPTSTPAVPQPDPSAGWDVPPPGQLKAAAQLVKKLRLRLQDAATIRSETVEAPGANMAEACARAELHLEEYETARRWSPALRAWLNAGTAVTSDLEQAVTSAFATTGAAFPEHAGPTTDHTPPLTNPSTPASESIGPAATQADEPMGAERDAQDEARAEFQAIIDLIRTAQADEDVKAVEAGRHLAGPLYARRLSSADRERYTPFMREVKAWCRDRAPRPHVDPQLRRIQELLAMLRQDRETLSVEDLRRTLQDIGVLRRKLNGPLSPSEQGAIKRWHGRLTYRQRTETAHRPPSSAQTPPTRKSTEAHLAPTDRLPLETIDKLADAARQVLQDQARGGGGLLTWGELRHRMGGSLPHLHPDDQGELLVSVDRETPEGEPLLSTLIASADTSLHWLYRHVRFSLGRERIPDTELKTHWAAEVLRLRQIWRYR